jgi:hypothetical protein
MHEPWQLSDTIESSIERATEEWELVKRGKFPRETFSEHLSQLAETKRRIVEESVRLERAFMTISALEWEVVKVNPTTDPHRKNAKPLTQQG